MYCAIRNFNDSEVNFGTEVKEIIIPLDKIDVLEILETTKNSDINYVYNLRNYIPTDEEIKGLVELVAVRDNIRFSTNLITEKLDQLPHFFNYGAMNAVSLDSMLCLCEMGVSDVYVSGQLGFQMKEARELAKRFGVRIRIVPNKAQGSLLESHVQKDGNLTAFWVRPEDLRMYEEYVDIVEFAGENSKQSVYYDVYFNSKKWKGDLSILIIDLFNVNNKGFISAFTEARMNCGKRCILDKCHSCHRYNIASNLIVENGLELKEEVKESI